MSAVPPYDHAEDDHANRKPYLWNFWFDSMIPLVRSTRPSSDIVPIGDFLFQWEKRDVYPGNHLLGSGCKHSTRLLAYFCMPNKQNKWGAEKQGCSGNRPSRGDSKSQSTRECIDGNSKLHCHLSILVKERILHLLSHFVISLSSVNQTSSETWMEKQRRPLPSKYYRPFLIKWSNILCRILLLAPLLIIPAMQNSLLINVYTCVPAVFDFSSSWQD